MDNLKNGSVDKRVSLYKGLIGAIPGAGPIISEIISITIPGQRLDRIAEFVNLLNERISFLEQETLKSNPHFVDLFEDALIQSARTVTAERNNFLSIFLSKSINVNQYNYAAKKKLFHILEELTDPDVMVLGEIAGKGHWLISREIEPPLMTMTEYEALTEEEKFERDLASSLWESHISTLERLHLVTPKRRLHGSVKPVGSINYDPKKKGELDNMHIDKKTGLPEITGYEATSLGRVLLRAISDNHT